MNEFLLSLAAVGCVVLLVFCVLLAIEAIGFAFNNGAIKARIKSAESALTELAKR